MISWLLFGAEDVLNSGESEYWPNRSFPGILFLTSFLAIANSLKLFHFKILFQKIYFPIKQVHFSHLPLFFLKSRHAVKHFNQINVFPSFFFFLKKDVSSCSISYAFLWPPLQFPWLLAYRCLPYLTYMFPLFTSFQTLLLSPFQLTWISPHCL